MLQVQLKLYSTNKIKLIKFLLFLKKYSIKWKLNFFQSLIFQFFTRLKKITVLKSPHVHKTAQEHFSLIKVKTLLNFSTFLRFNNIFLFLKYVMLMLFELKFKLKLQFLKLKKSILLGSLYQIRYSIAKVHPNNFLVKDRKSVTQYIQLFDIFGELNLLTLKNVSNV